MQKIFFSLKNIDKNIFKLIKLGISFSFSIGLFASMILLYYIFIGNIFSYYLGISLIKLSFSFIVEFIICGIVVDYIKRYN